MSWDPPDCYSGILMRLCGGGKQKGTHESRERRGMEKI